MVFQKVAVFGASGQVGSNILQALLHCTKQRFNIVAYVPPDSVSETQSDQPNIKVKPF